MDKNFSRVVRWNKSGLGCLVSLALFAAFLGAIGLGWVVKGAFIIVVFLFLIPVFAWLGLRLWISRSLVESSCPVCSYEFTGFLNRECRCPNCGEPLQVEKGQFRRLSAVGTIDVKAVDVGDD